MSAASIHFVCIAGDHGAASKTNTHPSPLTIHEGKWSYCAAGLMNDHEWRAIRPTALDELKRQPTRLTEKLRVP